MYTVKFENNNTYIHNLDCFELAATLDCGQAFRWRQLSPTVWEGIADNRYLKIEQSDNTIILHNTSESDFYLFWEKYFDLSRDYNKIIDSIENEKLKTAAEYGRGIRILRQEPWEALCSFIISQNNNIPRIKGIIERLCEKFGEKYDYGYSFPTAEKIAKLTVDDLAVLRSGFRAKYILDAAKKVANNEIDLEGLKSISTEVARQALLSIYGVGNKVADCALLFGLGHLDAFPKDVWIKRALEQLFGGELEEIESDFAGVYQQYIFYFSRDKKI